MECAASVFRLVDEKGQMRASLGLVDGQPQLVLHDTAQRPRLVVSLGDKGNPQVALHDGVNALPNLVIESDAKGSHVLLRASDERQTYVFLKNAGASGLVLVGERGLRQADFLLGPDGFANWTLWNPDGSVQATGRTPPPPPPQTETQI